MTALHKTCILLEIFGVNGTQLGAKVTAVMRAQSLESYQQIGDSIGLHGARQFLLPLSPHYPEVGRWFDSKVFPGIGSTRHLVFIERCGQIAAVGIAKNERGERKLCTIRVLPEYEGKGLGLRVMDKLLRWLDVDHPLATVSEEKMPQFQRIFDRYGFTLTSVENGTYRYGKFEYFFNEPNSPLMGGSWNSLI